MFTPFAFIQPYIPGILIPAVPDYMYVAGTFSLYKPPFYTRILRMDLSGSVDTTFNMGTGFNNTVYTMATQSDGKIIVGGTFTTYSGSASSYITRINTDGTRDATFNVGTGFNNTVRGIAVQSDDKIIAVGTFTSYSGSTQNRIIRLNTDGTRDATFNTGVGSTVQLNCVTIQSDGKILVGAAGNVTYSGSAASTGSFRINTNGTLDTTFNTGVGFSGTGGGNIFAIDIQSDGKYIMGGGFTTYNGSSINRLARINTDGTLDATFNPGNLNAAVYGIKVQPDQKIIAHGEFGSYSGSVITRIVRALPNGNRDTSFNVGTGLSFVVANFSSYISLDTSGNMYLGNGFTTYSGSTVNYFVKTNNSGAIDTTFNTGSIGYNGQSTRGFNNYVYTNLVSGSKLYAAGAFLSYDAPRYNRIIKLDNTGSIDTTFNMGAGFDNTVYTMATQSDGKIIAGGAFTLYSGSTRNRITRINTNGTSDATFNIGTGFNNEIYQTTVLSNGQIFVVGAFTTYSGSSSTNIVRINTNGTRDDIFNPGVGFTGSPYAFWIQPDGKIVVAGTFTAYSGSSVNRIVRINTDGTRDATFNIGTGFNTTAYAITGQSDGKILISGDFTTYSGSNINRLARINTDGTLDTTFQPGSNNGGIYNLKLLADGTILAAGVFTTYSGSTVSRFVRINSNGSRNTSWIPGQGANLGPNAWATLANNAISLDKNNAVYIGSSFTAYSSSTAGYIAKLNTNGVLDTSFNAGSLGFNGVGNGFDNLVFSIINLIT